MKADDPIKYALYLLGRRARTKRELVSKLQEKGYEAEAIDSAILRLINMKLVDDKAYAANYARDKVTIYRRGRYRIGLELANKGVAKEIIQDALEGLEEAAELEAAESLLASKQRTWQALDDRKRFERAVHLLQRRGFSGKIIRQLLNRYKKAA